jgi:transcriptional regulator with XRE-family HTH domain
MIDTQTIRRRMQQSGISQAELARRTGYHRQTIQNMLKGKHQPRRDILRAVATVLDIQDHLIDGGVLHLASGVSDPLATVRYYT